MPDHIRKQGRGCCNPLPALIGLPVTAALAWITYSKFFVPHNLALPAAVPGIRRETVGRAGRLSYYVEGAGAPLLLLHSINAAASAYEILPLFEQYRHSRRVYALDFPGFGFSDRSDRHYTPRLYTDAVLDMLDEIARDAGPQPVDALGLSLGCEFLARAATEQPDRFRSLALVSPTGFSKRDPRDGEPGSTLGNPGLRDFFNSPIWGRPIFDLLTSQRGIRFFMNKAFGRADTVPQHLLDYYYLTTHQPGAQHAPYAFVSGTLFSGDIGRIYAALSLPVWLAHGSRGDFSDYGGVQRVATRKNWTVLPLDTGAMPYFEQQERFCAAYDLFLEKITV